MSDLVVQTGNGEMWEVVEGELDQQPAAPMRLDVSDTVLAASRVLRDGGATDADAFTQALRDDGQPVVFVKRLPRDAGDGYCEGIQRVYRWDGATLMVANERPARAFYEHQRDDATAAKAAVTTDRDTAQTEVDRVDALETAATTVDAVKALNEPEGPLDAEGNVAPSPYEKRTAARAVVVQSKRRIDQTDAAIVDTKARLDALTSLGGDMLPIAAVEAEIARTGP